MRPLVTRALDESELRVDLFDADQLDEYGEFWLIAGAILPEQVEWFWGRYTTLHSISTDKKAE